MVKKPQNEGKKYITSREVTTPSSLRDLNYIARDNYN